MRESTKNIILSTTCKYEIFPTWIYNLDWFMIAIVKTLEMYFYFFY